MIHRRFTLPALLLALLLALVSAPAVLSSPAPIDQARKQDLISLSNTKTNVVKLTSSSKYRQLVLKPGRDWESVVMLSASTKVGCHRCPEWEEALSVAALAYKSSLKSGAEPKIIFFLVRFDDAGEVFQTYGLNHAPTLVWIPSDGKLDGKDPARLHTPRTLQLSHMEYALPDDIAGFVSSRTGYKFEIYYSPTFRVAVFAASLVALVASAKWLAVFIVPRLRRAKWLWFALSMAAYGLGVSGTIFVYLRNMPNMGKGDKGQPIYFAGDRNQFAFEGYLVGFLLLAASFSLVFAAYARLPSAMQPIEPLVHITALVTFALLFKVYIMIYMEKSHWYAYGFHGSRLVWPWIV